MKGEKWLSALEGALLACCIALGGCGCMVSGFEMNVSMTTVAVCCGLCAVVLALCFAFRQWVAALCALALAGGYLWQSQKAADGIEALLNRLSQVYDQGYQCGIIRWSGRALTDGDLTVGICLVGALVTLVICLVVCRRGRAYFGLLAALAPLAACLVVTDTVPGMNYLFLLLLGVLLLLLTQTTRRKSPVQSARLLGMLALPSAFALALLFWAIPQEEYAGQDNAEKAANAVVNYVQDLAVPEAEQPWQAFGLELGINGMQPDKVNLSQLGPQTQWTSRVMNVSAAQTGPVYLRGCSFDTYDGKSWTNTVSCDYEQELWPDGNLETVGEVTVTTRSVHPVMYFPYYPGEMDWQQFTDGRLNNTDDLTTYTFSQMRIPSGYSGRYLAERIIMLEPFLTLPEKTRTGATEILAQIFPDGIQNMTFGECASAIASYVRNSAVYDLGTERMPTDAEDFALWFLNQSDTGYCVHFATAAAVLLRAAGIPARYVTGYLVDGVAGKPVAVSAGDAHAWVEYYVPDVGWMMLEATPSAGDQEAQGEQQAPSVQPSWVQSTRDPDQTAESGASTPEEDSQIPDAEREHLDLGGIPGLFWCLIWIAVLAAAVIGQWRLRLYLRQWGLQRGGPNEQALARWREVMLLSRLLEEKPDMALFELAQKAKYSQYTLSQEELSQFDAYLASARTRLRQKSLPKRLIDRLIFAAY